MQEAQLSYNKLSWSNQFGLAERRRRSVDNRDNGAPKESAWHGVESVEAAVEILNDL